MAKDIFYTAIDIGSGKVTTLIAGVGPEGDLKVVGTGHAPSQGMEKGSIVNTAEVREAIQASLMEAEKYLGKRAPAAYVSISGSQITCHNTTALMRPPNKHSLVSFDEVQTLVNSSYPAVSPEKEVIHVIPVNYWIDGYRGVRSPVGLHADRIQVQSHVVMGERAHVYETIRAVETCNIPVKSLVLSALASSESTLSEHEKEVGVVLVDIGEGTTDIAIFKHGGLWYNGSIPVGGKQFTRDLSVALGMPYYFAEELKIKWGHARLDESEAAEEALLPSFQGQSRRMIRRGVLCKPLNERLQETLALIMVKVQQAGLSRFPTGGMVITGGVAEMPGIQQMARQAAGCSVRVASPKGLRGLSVEQTNPAYSTAVGLLLWGIRHHGDRRPMYGNDDKNPWGHKMLMHRIKKLIEAK